MVKPDGMPCSRNNLVGLRIKRYFSLKNTILIFVNLDGTFSVVKTNSKIYVKQIKINKWHIN